MRREDLWLMFEAGAITGAIVMTFVLVVLVGYAS